MKAWPTRGGDPFAITSTQSPNTWSPPNRSTPRRGIRPWSSGADLLDEIGRLRQGEGRDLLIWGAGRLTDALAAAGLLDEYRICTAPVIKGGGKPLFRPASTGTVELLDTNIFATGAVVHAYRPASAR